jgi:hypothetical protein
LTAPIVHVVKLVPGEAEVGECYVCTDCDDPIRNQVTRKWVESSLKPPQR